MKASQVYRKAAQRIERGFSDRACYAINAVLGLPLSAKSAEKMAYVDQVLCGSEITSYLYSAEDEMNGWMDMRVVALCFMAAIAEDEERTQKRSPR